jgi:tryptophan-rich sensory protein
MENKFVKLLISVIGCLFVGVTGGLFTYPAIQSWYVTLNKPFFTPPNWIFGPVWTILYILMGISLYLIWSGKGKEHMRRQAMRYFLLQLALNFLWSIGFFGLRDPLLIRAFLSFNKHAGYLLMPYLAWVSFATLLNGAIVFLN